MNQEYKSKVNDAFKMVLERIENNQMEDFSEMDMIASIKCDSCYLVNSLDRNNMKSQKRDAIKIASTAILYMVKFL